MRNLSGSLVKDVYYLVRNHRGNSVVNSCLCGVLQPALLIALVLNRRALELLRVSD
jgi:hypothetical protein